SEIVAEGICLCNEIKLHKQIQKEKFSERKFLETFCEQLGFINNPKLSSKKRINNPTKSKDSSDKKYYRKQKKKIEEHPKDYKKRRQKGDSSKRNSNTKTFPVCWKCHTPGHYANKCKMKKKIQSLDVDEKLKSFKETSYRRFRSRKRGFKISVITEIDSEKEHNSDNSSDNENEYSDNESDEVDENQASNNCEGNCDYYKALCQANGLMVLTKEENFFLDLIDKIPDPQEKKLMLQKYLESYKDQKIEKKLKLKEPEVYNFKDIMNRVKNSTISTSTTVDITTAELRHEVKVLKQELQELKSRVTTLELKAPKDSFSDEGSEQEENILQKEELNSLTFINMIDRVITHKWHTEVTIVVHKEYFFSAIAMIDSGADLNCINEGIVPSQYFSKTTEILNAADGRKLFVNYKLQNTSVCNK
ncbi:UNVERIFIED_CONTAM: hypothetical protein Sangu_3203900, partial [Sesamum angustifolium]